MKALILGGTGLLGRALMREWTGDEVFAMGSQNVDIRNVDQVRAAVQKLSPDWIVLVAAYTDVDGCESNHELAFSVNRDGAVNVAKTAQSTGAKLLFVSTDYVFDGKKSSPYEVGDQRNPQSVYGRSKAEAEVELLRIVPDCCVARTSWLFGTRGKCFPDTILKLAESRPVLDVVNDQRGSPTYVIDLARVIIHLCRKGARGIIHATNSGDCTWFDFAREIVRKAGLATVVRPVSSRQMVRPAPRPAFSVLSSTSLRQYGIEMPAWEDALVRYLEERKSIESA